mmetsp:Transcript_36262/g.87401  ORF Transcript_36262/g.87401 Transcript_36262/m.87401 type:complete len:210 (+) Transcript_36262:1255-1884(+)
MVEVLYGCMYCQPLPKVVKNQQTMLKILRQDLVVESWERQDRLDCLRIVSEGFEGDSMITETTMKTLMGIIHGQLMEENEDGIWMMSLFLTCYYHFDHRRRLLMVLELCPQHRNGSYGEMTLRMLKTAVLHVKVFLVDGCDGHLLRLYCYCSVQTDSHLSSSIRLDLVEKVVMSQQYDRHRSREDYYCYRCSRCCLQSIRRTGYQYCFW